MFDHDILFAFAITLFAGLATGLGSFVAFWTKTTNKKFLSFTLGFSAGVMIYVSFVEIFAKAQDSLSLATNNTTGSILTTLGFFGGMIFIAIIDKCIPNDHGNPHQIYGPEDISRDEIDKKKLLRMGTFTAIAIAIHNFPEGLATFLSVIENPSLGISIAIAIAIHNIPEGIAVAVSVYNATGNKKKAFLYSFLSGISEPIGAIIGYFILMQFFNDYTFGLIFAGVGGIMVFISLDQLLPTAQKYGEHHLSIYGLMLGMMVMASSLILFLV